MCIQVIGITNDVGNADNARPERVITHRATSWDNWTTP